MGYTLSKKEIVREILKCGKKPYYFINNYCRISHPMKGLVAFNTYDYQDRLLEDFNDYRFNVVCKARQLGVTTIVAAYCVWLLLFHKEKNILIVATKFNTAAGIVKKTKAILKSLPSWLLISDIEIDNRSSFELANGSQIKASSTSIDAGRSEALSLLVIDEAAHVDNMEELWTALYPCISTGGRCIALSTPKGTGNFFHRTYVDAEAGINDFSPTLLPWDVHPERDIDWFNKETRNMSKRQIAQELMCQFNASGETVIDAEYLERIERGIKDPIERIGQDRNIWIWERYHGKHTYFISADVARGDGVDNSAFQCLKVETMECVAEYRGKATPDIFAGMLYSFGGMYDNCMIAVENNNVGFMVSEKLKEMEYPNVYHSLKSTHEYVEQYVADSLASAIPGVATTQKTRPMIVAKLEEYIRNNMIKIYSKRFLEEIKTFIWRNGRPEAMRGYNDDLVMSTAIACWVKDVVYETSQKDTEYRSSLLNAMSKTNTQLETRIPGMVGFRGGGPAPTLNAEKRKEILQYSWLYKG